MYSKYHQHSKKAPAILPKLTLRPTSAPNNQIYEVTELDIRPPTDLLNAPIMTTHRKRITEKRKEKIVNDLYDQQQPLQALQAFAPLPVIKDQKKEDAEKEEEDDEEVTQFTVYGQETQTIIPVETLIILPAIEKAAEYDNNNISQNHHHQIAQDNLAQVRERTLPLNLDDDEVDEENTVLITPPPTPDTEGYDNHDEETLLPSNSSSSESNYYAHNNHDGYHTAEQEELTPPIITIGPLLMGCDPNHAW